MGVLDWFSSSSSSSSSSSRSPSPETGLAAPSVQTTSSLASSPAPAAGPKKVMTSEKLVSELNPKGIKPCCACPETKSLRDDCFFKSNLDPTSEEGQKRCEDVVRAHRECMKGLGFKV